MVYAIVMTGVTSLFPRPTPWIQFPAYTGPQPTIEPLIGYEWLVWTVMLFVKLFPEMLLEEVIFRTFPLRVAAWRKLPDWWYLVLVPVAAFFFVFCGPHDVHLSVPLSGALELGFSVAYLKLGGYQGKWFTANVVHHIHPYRVRRELDAVQRSAVGELGSSVTHTTHRRGSRNGAAPMARYVMKYVRFTTLAERVYNLREILILKSEE